MKNKIYLLAILILIFKSSICQRNFKANELVKWEIAIGRGLYADLLWTLVGPPPGYSDLERKRINFGKIDRAEVKFYLSKTSALSLYYQSANWKEMYGKGLDPLELWKGLSRYNRRFHFSMNYNKIITLKKNTSISFGTGFQIQIEKIAFPYYIVDTIGGIVTILEIGARPDKSYWEDWAIPITLSYYKDINKNLKLGCILNSAYTMGSGFDGLSLLGSISIPIKRHLKK